nr:hypothetical protein [uncultured Psychroserpens sp.]
METDLFTSEGRREQIILDGYHLCGSGCNQPAERDGDTWCLTVKDCQAKGCSCHLFSSDKDAPPHDPDSWRHEANPEKKVQTNKDRVYRCFCVKKIDI